VTKSKEVKTGYNLTESSEKGYGSETAVLPMMIMIINKSYRCVDLSMYTLEVSAGTACTFNSNYDILDRR
jgi:hypothetical protein